jgi:ATP-dependent helicase/nuclease subunit A
MRAVLAHLPQGPRRVADFDGMHALLLRLEAGHADALGVVRRLERYAAAGVEVARPALRARGAVALLTVHAAKGLEWPVVVLADLGGRGRGDAPDVLLDPSVGVALRARDQDGEGATYRLARRTRTEEERAEARRLAYVAFTRARDVLIVSDRGGRLAGLGEALGDALDAAEVPVEVVAASEAASAPPPLPPEPPAPDPHDPLWRRGR